MGQPVVIPMRFEMVYEVMEVVSDFCIRANPNSPWLLAAFTALAGAGRTCMFTSSVN